MSELSQIQRDIGALNTNFETLAKETERARARDEKIFAALDAIRVGQATITATVSAHSTQLANHEIIIGDYKTDKSRAYAIMFLGTTIAGMVGYWFEHVRGWFKG